MKDPYTAEVNEWSATTEKLLRRFPLAMEDLVRVVLASWEDIFHSRIGERAYQIGRDIWPDPQVMGFLLHELVPLNLGAAYPGKWRRGMTAESDVVYVPSDAWSFEIKTSSSPRGIFGNRSYVQIRSTARKRRGSFFLAVNFGKFGTQNMRPEITLIRFGWLGPKDWIGQAAQSGQRARLTKEARAYKLKIIYEQLLE